MHIGTAYCGFFSLNSKGIYDALRHLVPSVQFKKREKQPWTIITFSKVARWGLQFY